ncbi:ISC system 2Fe-2S type ferredoxin [Sapientia aquatica]|uniref:2Fe-2S ferredoxin n=1 Tax=Sapientia aquatica TaxID=1549640 RepID=A0A4V3AV38_9BURK|nr:ISC system 2Fe-2S type ferredoxin [Sapientia aquatica]TDK68206.1 ISC system 2Fe-2S type ferredoxin [Sapientia aquatica]
MSKITVLPHQQLCPEGAVLEAEEGASLCEVLVDNNIAIEHACEMSCACTTCHVIVREGFNSLNDSTENEEDLLDAAWGLEATSRLSCQVRISSQPIVIEIPKYTINHARENH